MRLYEMITDDSLQSAVSSGTPEFPFISFYDEIDKFQDRCIAWHWHKEFELTEVERGPVCCEIGAERITLDAGDGLFINGGVIHRFASDGGGTLKDVLFAPGFIAHQDSILFQKFVAPAILSSLQYYIFRAAEPLHRSFLAELNEIYQLAQTDDALYELRVRNVVAVFWEHFYPVIQTRLQDIETVSDHLLKARMQLMLDYIRREYAKPIQLEDIAASAKISKSEALRCFRRSIQTSPMSYLNDYRLDRACELLRAGSDTITSIAWNTGFRSAGYFCRVFKERFHQTPDAFRKAAQLR